MRRIRKDIYDYDIANVMMEYYVQPIKRDDRTYSKAEIQVYYMEIDRILSKQTDE